MSWIKRNLLFVIGGVAALALLGLAGYYLYNEWTQNSESTSKLEAAHAELSRIANLQPNPGNDKVDNIANAKDYTAKVRAEVARLANLLTPIPGIPPGTNVTGEAFKGTLLRTLDELTRDAASASVTIQPKYDFSFSAQKPLVKFSGSLDPLAAALGDVREICDVLFKAKINTLYSLRRSRVSDDDQRGSQADYIDTSPVTNDLAVLVPYEVTFYGFSGELASVLTGFAASPHGFIVTAMAVDPGTPTFNAVDANGLPSAEGGLNNPYGGMNRYGNDARLYSRYAQMMQAQQNAQLLQAQQNAQSTSLGTGKGGLPVVLDERQLRVTLELFVVKLLAPK